MTAHVSGDFTLPPAADAAAAAAEPVSVQLNRMTSFGVAR